MQPEHYHNGKSKLEDIVGFDMISQLVLDYMHIVCLGVTHKMLNKLFKGNMEQRMKNLDLVSDRLCSLKSDIPQEFARKPRPFLGGEKWKATKYRQFLLYRGILVLKGEIPDKKYNHFLSLTCVIRILSSGKLLTYIDYAHALLVYFVSEFGNFYGAEQVSYNVHGLLHLCDEVKQYGVLDNFTL